MPLVRFDGWEISLFEIGKIPAIRARVKVFKAPETTNPPVAGPGFKFSPYHLLIKSLKAPISL
jgi:hypothetical protein